MLSHDDLFNYFRMNFALMHYHDYSLTELDGMMPWERDVLVQMISQQVKDDNEKMRLRAQEAKFR